MQLSNDAARLLSNADAMGCPNSGVIGDHLLHIQIKFILSILNNGRTERNLDTRVFNHSKNSY